MATLSELREAAAAFSADGAICPVSPLGCGNINDTFLVASAAGPFVLQRINRRVFPDPLRVINNFAKVAGHLSGSRWPADRPFRTALPVPALSGGLFHRDVHGDYWRAQTYLSHSSCKTLSGPVQAFQIGRALACFHVGVSDLDVRSIEDPLPGFHNLPRYLQEFDRLPATIRKTAHADHGYCLDVIDRGRQRATVLEEAKNSGVLAIQLIHGDPKIDNFLFDQQGLAAGMLDLDTVGAGLVHYDLGDCLRSCCNRAGERGPGSAEVAFDMVLCKALLQGYFSLPHQLLSAGQRDYIFDAVMAITFELGLRFFTDHLQGNTYFKVRRDGDNLARAVRQFRLLEDVERREKDIRSLTTS